MPGVKASGTSKKSFNKAVSANISELTHHGKKKRSHEQKIAIAINQAKGGKGRYSNRKP